MSCQISIKANQIRAMSQFFTHSREYPKVCVNLQTDVR